MKLNKYLLAVFSGILLALSFPPSYLFFLSFVGFVPLLYLFNTQDIRKKSLILYISFFIYHSGTNWWIGSWQADSDPYLTASSIALAIVHPFFFMIPFGLYFTVKEKLGRNVSLYLFPFFWVAFEWFHNLGEFSYPWLTIGNTQIYNYFWIQFVDISGVWGASLLILLMNILITQILLKSSENGFANILKDRIIQLKFVLIIAIITIPLIYGYFRVKEFDHKILLSTKSNFNVGLVQPSINPWRKWEMSVDEMIDIQKNISDSMLATAKRPDLIVWNETAIPKYIVPDKNYTYLFLSEWVKTINTSIFTGFAELKYYNSANKTPTARQDTTLVDSFYESYNSVLLLSPENTDKIQVYRKMRLTPMAERLPYSEFLMFMRSWFEWGVGISAWGIGREQKNMELNLLNLKISIGPVICIESIYPEFVSNTTKNGAGVIIVITNDAWYDYTPGPEQHYLISAMRAIENRRYIARCANTGITGLISPTGKTISRLEPYTKAGLSETVPILDNKSIYVRFGDWIAFLSFIITIASIIINFIRKK